MATEEKIENGKIKASKPVCDRPIGKVERKANVAIKIKYAVKKYEIKKNVNRAPLLSRPNSLKKMVLKFINVFRV